MTQNYEVIVKGIRNFENKVTVTLALRDKKRFDGEIFDLDISLDRVEGAALEFYEAAARRSIRLNRPGFPGECFICELRLPDHRFRWKHNKLFLLLPEE
ncbi:DUF1327 domain-containing protein, partial [Escherichia coli]|uniref:DUF1327 domain-containing protein n=2 Tax=Escherichia coli TaxID=562 RepID=UPI00203AB2F6